MIVCPIARRMLVGPLIAIAVVGGAGVGETSAAAADHTYAARRVLIVSLPGVAWADLRGPNMPHLKALLAQSAVANMAVRVTSLRTAPGNGYATLGSGTRAVAPVPVAGAAFGRLESLEAGSAAEAFARRSGRPLAGTIGQVNANALRDSNSSSLFGGELGALGDSLAKGDVNRGVVGNADWASRFEGTTELPRREAALALMDHNGDIPCGVVDQSLLIKDPAYAFGLRLDHDRVVSAFKQCWRGRSVVLVEASDLRRADDYRSFVTSERSDAIEKRALENADSLVGQLLEGVDLERDAVVVVAPSSRSGRAAHLNLFALHAPRMGAGLLRSSVTRQDGFVSIVDFAPTVAALAGTPLDEGEVEGRPVTVTRQGGTSESRLETLIDADDDAVFRDRVLFPFAITFITLQILLSAAFAWSLWKKRKFPLVVEVGTLALLACLPLTYWAALMPFSEWGYPAYFSFTLGGAACIAAALHRWARHPLLPLTVLLGAIIATAAVSVVVLDSRLQLSTVFGDSPIIAGRFSGINNVTFSQLMVAAIVLAVFLAHQLPRRTSLPWIAALLGGVLLVDVAPMWGADVGGILAGVPGLALTLWLLSGKRVRLRHILICGLATAAAVMLLGALDLARDPSERTHLGRLFERVGSEGWDGLFTIVDRKRQAMMTSLSESVWRFMVVPTALAVGYLTWRAPASLHGLRQRIPELDSGLVGIAAVGVLGLVLNDSGVAVPGVMLGVAVPTLTYLTIRMGRDPEDGAT